MSSSSTPGSQSDQNRPANQVTLTNVCKAYGSHVILNDISAVIPAGETVALIGPSGGGKSTLLRCINGLAPFDRGQVEVGNLTLTPKSDPATVRQVRHRFGMIFQDFQLFPHFTALQNVTEGPIQVRKQSPAEARERAMALLKRVGLDHRAGAYPRELSGGQKQRVAIARALAMNPQGLLCDEITSALDPELKSEVLDVMLDLKAEGLTLIMVTHEIHFARRAADRVLLLADGAIAESGPPEQVLEAPSCERAKRFLHKVMA